MECNECEKESIFEVSFSDCSKEELFEKLDGWIDKIKDIEQTKIGLRMLVRILQKSSPKEGRYYSYDDLKELFQWNATLHTKILTIEQFEKIVNDRS
jgi:hypothetical protein